ncbi:MAG TPA: GNAT family N-acetyltransferase [Euzebya sp.]|nr:GNAT family N-acetyltransferase [Euzebya sp.]
MPAPAITDLELERVAALGWQAPVSERLGDWLLRAADGFTGRANSVLPLGDPGMPLDDALDRVTSWYTNRGLHARLQVFAPAQDGLRAAILDRGAVPAHGGQVMVASITDVTVHGPPAHPVRLEAHPSAAWQAQYHYRGAAALPPVAVDLLSRGEVTFANVCDGDTVVGIARGALGEGWLGITAVEVADSHRRRGLATSLQRALAEWAAGRGATGIYLQVDLDNDIAQRMYRRAGFTDHHTYRYLDLPVGGRAR